MKRRMLVAALLAGMTAAGTAYGENLSGPERVLFGPDGTTLRSVAVQKAMRHDDRTPESRRAVMTPARKSLSGEALKVWWR